MNPGPFKDRCSGYRRTTCHYRSDPLGRGNPNIVPHADGIQICKLSAGKPQLIGSGRIENLGLRGAFEAIGFISGTIARLIPARHKVFKYKQIISCIAV